MIVKPHKLPSVPGANTFSPLTKEITVSSSFSVNASAVASTTTPHFAIRASSLASALVVYFAKVPLITQVDNRVKTNKIAETLKIVLRFVSSYLLF